MKKLLVCVAVLSAMLMFGGCTEGSNDIDDNNPTQTPGDNPAPDNPGITYSVNGNVQKGQYIQGSSITIQELDDNLNPTGTNYQTQITDDMGTFKVSSEIKSRYVEIIANGYYFNEVSGKLSDGTLTLRAIADLADEGRSNVNLLTSLETPRIYYLVANEKMNIASARKQAESEIYKSFNIPDEDVASAVGFDKMDISRPGVSNAVLLAISVTLQHNRTVAELSEIISKIASDIEKNGVLKDVSLRESVRVNGMDIDAKAVAFNLEQRYKSLSYTGYAIPDFDEYLDINGNGVIDRLDKWSTFEFGDVDIYSEEQDVVFNMSANFDYTVNIPADAKDWVHAKVETRAIEMKPTTLTLHVDENKTGAARSAVISVLDDAGNTCHTATLKQSAWGREIVFADANFRDYCFNNFDRNRDGELSIDEIMAVTSINVNSRYNNYNITSLQGIERFENLTSLDCSWNQLESLDLSNNTALTYLDCSYNQLVTLDLSYNTALTTLICHTNRIPSLNVSKNAALTHFECGGNRLTSLDVSQNPRLIHLECNANKLNNLDVSKNPKLTYLGCEGNLLMDLDVSKNTALTNLMCHSNLLTSLDVSKNMELTDLFVFENPIASLDVSNHTKLAQLLVTTPLMPHHTLQSLDVSGCTALVELSCANGSLEKLNVSGCTALISLGCFRNVLTSLDVSDCSALKGLSCDSNQLTSLNVDKCTQLQYLDCSDNQLTRLDVSQNTALSELRCMNNQLKTLNVSKNKELFMLQCTSNQLTDLEVSNCMELKHLMCSQNQLTSLDLSRNTLLLSLACNENLLTDLNINNCYNLSGLDCRSNQLTSLDVSARWYLNSLDCSSNLLETLDVSETNLPYGTANVLPLHCSMETLKTLYLKRGWQIPGITPDRHPDCISDHTEIVFIN